MIDVDLIKNLLLNETGLTDWAKEELKIAREEGETSYTSFEKL